MDMLEVPIQRILKDETFRFARRDPEKISRIEASVRISGLLNPLWVRTAPGGFQITAGFSRCDAVRSAGLVKIPIRKIPSDIPAGEMIRQILFSHRTGSEFNILEKARVLKIMETIDTIDHESRKKILNLLELPNKSSLLSEVMDLLKLEPEIQAYIEAYGVSLKQASRFSQFNADAQRLCARLANVLFIRPVELLEICGQIHEIARRDKLTIPDLNRNLAVQDLLKSDAPRNQKIGELKYRIHQSRFPKLTEWNRSIETSAKSLGLPKSVQLKWDRTLEEPGVQIHATVRSVEEIQNLTGMLSSRDAEKSLNALFHILS